MRKRSKFLVVMLLIAFIFAGCDFSLNSVKDNQSKQWVFMKIQSHMLRDSIEYFYYGQVDKSVIDRINRNDCSGFVMLSNIRYINDSDKIEIYEDDTDWGSRIYRIKNVVQIDILKQDPILTSKIEDLAPNAKEFKKKRK